MGFNEGTVGQSGVFFGPDRYIGVGRRLIANPKLQFLQKDFMSETFLRIPAERRPTHGLMVATERRKGRWGIGWLATCGSSRFVVSGACRLICLHRVRSWAHFSVTRMSFGTEAKCNVLYYMLCRFACVVEGESPLNFANSAAANSDASTSAPTKEPFSVFATVKSMFDWPRARQ